MMKRLIVLLLILIAPSVMAADLGDHLNIEFYSGTVTINTTIITGTNISCSNVADATYNVCTGVGAGDTNETTRTNRILSTNCTGQTIAYFYNNGTGVCEADDSGAGLVNNSDVSFRELKATYYYNVTINKSQVRDFGTYFGSLANFTDNVTNSKICIYESYNNKINCNYTDQTGSGASDGNASSICGDNEVLLGQDTIQCIDLNATIDLLDDDTIYSDSWINTSVNTKITNNISSVRASITGNRTLGNNSMKDYVDNTFSTTDYNTNCTADQSCANILYESDLPLANKTVIDWNNITSGMPAGFSDGIDNTSSYSDSWINTSVNTKITNNISSVRASITGNITLENTTMKDYVDNTFITSYVLDGNASSICADNEVLLGQDSAQCIDLNATIDLLDDDTIYSDSWINNTIDSKIDTDNGTIRDYVDNTFITTDTNETVNVGRIISTNCTGQVIAFFHDNGTGVCEADDSGAGLTNGTDVSFRVLKSTYYYNVTINKSQVKDFGTYFSSLDNFTDNVTNSKICIYESYNNKINCNYTDVSGSGANDGNASSICGDNEVLLGQDSAQCIDLNATIDLLDDDTIYSDSWINTSVNTKITNNISSVRASITGNITLENTTMKGYVDNTFITTDTNETTNVYRIISTNCTGQVIAFFHDNGTGVCEADDTGAGSSDGNASSICGDNEVLLGQDSAQCIDLNATIDLLDDDTIYSDSWINTSVNTKITNNISSVRASITGNITLENTTMKDYVDNTFITTDTNETTRVNSLVTANQTLFTMINSIVNESDTNESTRTWNIINTNCTGNLIATFYDNGTGICETDDGESYSDLWINTTIDYKITTANNSIKDYVDNTFITSYADAWINASVNTKITNNISSVRASITGNITLENTTMKDYVDNTFITTDTNETTNVYRIISTNCTGQVIAFFHDNGTGVCEADDSGTGLTNNSDVSFRELKATYYYNVTINKSQVRDFGTYFGSLANFTDNVTNSKICIYESYNNKINCNYTDQTNAYADAWINTTIDLKIATANSSIKDYADNTFMTSYADAWINTTIDLKVKSANSSLLGYVNKTFLNTTTAFGGEVSGTYGSITIGNDVLDDQYYDSEADLTGLLYDNYVNKTGDTMTGNLAMGDYNVTGLDCITFTNGAKICGV